ncbi:ABC-type transport auxiliary lipoprotein family protein [Microbulbifer pacificus]|uniref:ABC-type transport auxiliary lipoprotein family protein n=1 Tax=Microbulbifer pacificus TaxID=407164 RepID=A0AAU0N0J6_9GAMM|nr:ABC-type transport auxiliary lipoprotein family protein [Microbulbifer pacificus]WOX05941.1 ABC-type transport auxiliary lipoprotein family protein [Microbulbifer pacificus]
MTENGYLTLAKFLLAACLTTMLSGCSLFSRVDNETQVALINKLPAEIPQRETHAETLLVLAPATNPVYDTTRMVYRVEPYQIDYFSKHEWGATPAQMLHPLLTLSLENTHYFSTVVSPPYFGPYTYALHTEILELTQDFSSDPATLHLSLRVQLSDGTSKRIMSSWVISLQEQLQENTPYAGVAAANEATAKALQEVTVFVLEAVR